MIHVHNQGLVFESFNDLELQKIKAKIHSQSRPGEKPGSRRALAILSSRWMLFSLAQRLMTRRMYSTCGLEVLRSMLTICGAMHTVRGTAVGMQQVQFYKGTLCPAIVYLGELVAGLLPGEDHLKAAYACAALPLPVLWRRVEALEHVEGLERVEEVAHPVALCRSDCVSLPGKSERDAASAIAGRMDKGGKGGRGGEGPRWRSSAAACTT